MISCHPVAWVGCLAFHNPVARKKQNSKLSLSWSLIIYTQQCVLYASLEYAKQLKPNRKTAPGGNTQPTMKTTSRTKKRRSRRGSSTSVHLGFSQATRWTKLSLTTRNEEKIK